MENKELTRLLMHHDPRLCAAYDLSRETELVINRILAVVLNGAKLSRFLPVAEVMTEYMSKSTRSILDHAKLDKEETERVLMVMVDICATRVVSERLDAIAEGRQALSGPDDPADLH